VLLGLCIPVLLGLHIASTRAVEVAHGVDTGYTYVLTFHWVVSPVLGVLQVAALLTLWIHACIGLHFWLRTKRWYPQWRGLLSSLALLVPVLAVSGYVAAGNQVMREAAKDPEFVKNVLGDSNVTDVAMAFIGGAGVLIVAVHLALIGLVLVARGVRRGIEATKKVPVLSHAAGVKVPVLGGATVLECLRDHGIPHASVCGGRARCTTCRIQVTRGAEALPAPMALEAKALERIGAAPGIRLACQVRPNADIAVTPLLAADASAADGFTRGGLEGSERLITVMFVDLRGSTTIGEAKLPYDVLFLLNRFFYEMNQSIAATNGHYSQFTGDGLMALYGLHADDPSTGPAEALRGAREMLMRVEQLNHQLKHELPQPLQIGIGIHYSEAIVGMMGPPRSMIITAIGDTVNTAARLESLTKEYQCNVVVSRPAAEAAGIDVSGHTLHEAPVKGRVQTMQFYALQTVPEPRK
jgi:adenylate cyclase